MPFFVIPCFRVARISSSSRQNLVKDLPPLPNLLTHISTWPAATRVLSPSKRENPGNDVRNITSLFADVVRQSYKTKEGENPITCQRRVAHRSFLRLVSGRPVCFVKERRCVLKLVFMWFPCRPIRRAKSSEFFGELLRIRCIKIIV